MGVRRGGQEVAHAPPPRPLASQNSMFFEENIIFLGVLGANSMFLPPPPPAPWKILPSPGKKSADAHAYFTLL